jgi:hypothetical protein
VDRRAEAAEAPRFLFDLHHGPSVCAGKTVPVFPPDRGGDAMDATVRRYDGIDTTRSRASSSKGRFEERKTAQVPVLQWPTMLKGGRMAMLAQLVARLRGALKK